MPAGRRLTTAPVPDAGTAKTESPLLQIKDRPSAVQSSRYMPAAPATARSVPVTRSFRTTPRPTSSVAYLRSALEYARYLSSGDHAGSDSRPGSLVSRDNTPLADSAIQRS